MKPKDYLNQIALADSRINNKLEELDQLYALATKVTPTLSQDKGSGFNVSDKVGNVTAKIVDMKDEINNDIDRYLNLKRDIITKLDQLNDERYYTLLHMRYVHRKKFDVIANEMGYDYQSIINMHGRALQEFEKLL